MRSLQIISADMSTTADVRGLVETYQEIAAGNMQHIRKSTVSSRDFTEGLSALAQAVGSDLAATEPGRLPKTAAVWVSANAGLYGDIIEKTLAAFLEYIRNHKADVFVLGESGRQLLATISPKTPVTVLPFSDDTVDESALSTLRDAVSGYEHVVVFFGKFKSIAVQTPDHRIVSGDILPEIAGELDRKERNRRQLAHIYEPSPLDVSRFVASEIQVSVIEQTLYEAMLGKFASRLMHLDEAMDHIGDRLEHLSHEHRKVKRIRDDRKQRTMLAGMRARRTV